MNLLDQAAALAARQRLLHDCEEMKRMLHGLLDSKGRVAEEIHAIRKLGKSLRGGFALFGLGKSAASQVQAIGRLLAASRDAVSRFNTWNKLGWVGDRAACTAIAGLLEQQTHSAARRPPPEAIDWCSARMDAACAELRALPEDTLAGRCGEGLDKLRRKLRKRFRDLDHGREEDFHEARKALKAWLGALGFLPDPSPAADSLPLKLADWLGDENDFATLGIWLSDHGFTDLFVPDLWQCLSAERRRLQDKAAGESKRLRNELKTPCTPVAE
ncbi:MAG: CHAD domain-containing protein [Luteolibacter sp.]